MPAAGLHGSGAGLIDLGHEATTTGRGAGNLAPMVAHGTAAAEGVVAEFNAVAETALGGTSLFNVNARCGDATYTLETALQARRHGMAVPRGKVEILHARQNRPGYLQHVGTGRLRFRIGDV